MKPEIGFMSQLSTKNVLDDLRFAVKHGFEWFEIGLDWKQNYDLKPQIRRKIRQISEINGIRLIIHTPFYLPTATMIPEVRQGVMENVKKAIMLAQEVGADRVTVHPGYREMPGPGVGLCYQSLVQNLREIVKMGRQKKIEICLENSEKSSYLLCSGVNEFLKVLKDVKGLKATFDIGHANTTGVEPAEYFRKAREFVVNMHVHDNTGGADEHKSLGQGNMDIRRVLRGCIRHGYSGPFILEVFPYGAILESRKVLQQFWEEVDGRKR